MLNPPPEIHQIYHFQPMQAPVQLDATPILPGISLHSMENYEPKQSKNVFSLARQHSFWKSGIFACMPALFRIRVSILHGRVCHFAQISIAAGRHQGGTCV